MVKKISSGSTIVKNLSSATSHDLALQIQQSKLNELQLPLTGEYGRLIQAFPPVTPISFFPASSHFSSLHVLF
jgi:hypothetical protein